MENQTEIKDVKEQLKEKVKTSTKLTTMSGMKSNDINSLLSNYKLQIAQALPKHLSADRMIQICTTLISQNPLIKDCSITSLIGAVMQSSILGFKPVAHLGYCYFVPFANGKTGTKDIQFQIGYKGYIDLARRSGEIETIYAEVVYKGDEFHFELGLNPVLKHIPNLEIERTEITHVYAVAKYKNGGYNFIVLTKKQIESLRKRSPSQRNGVSGAWLTDYDSMAKAKAVKQLSKYMPLSIDVAEAIGTDEAIIKVDNFKKEKENVFVDSVEIPEIDSEYTETMKNENEKDNGK